MTLLISIIFIGVLKYNSISNFFNSILDGTADLSAQNTQVPENSHNPTSGEQKIGRKQMDDPHNKEEDTNERAEDLIQRAIRIQLEKEEREAKDVPIVSFRKTGETDPVIPEERTAAETAHPFNNMKPPLQASVSCNPGTVTDGAVLSCASPVSERETLSTREDTTSEPGHVRDEL